MVSRTDAAVSQGLCAACETWLGRTFPQRHPVSLLEIQRSGAQLYIVASDEYPVVPPRIFVAQRSNVLREVSKRELPSLQSWTPEATLLSVAAEAAEIAGRA